MKKRNTLEILQSDIEIPDIVQKKANDTFEIIREKKVVGNENTRAIPSNSRHFKKASKFPKRRIAVVAAFTTLTLATVSAAAAYLNWSKSLSEGLQVTEEQIVQLEESHMSTFVNQSCTDQGITVTAVQSITDNYYTHIAFKVEGFEVEDGVQPDFETFKVTVDGKEDINSGASFYNGLIQGPDGKVTNADGTPLDVDENGVFIEHYTMEDGSMEYQITLSNNEEKGFFINKPIHVEFQNLGTVYKAEYTNEINGTWTFDWDLQGDEDMKECTLNVPLGDTNATVVKAELSPISLRAEYEFPRTEKTEIALDENGEEITVHFYEEPPALSGVKMKDGTLHPFIYMGPGSAGYMSEDSDRYMSAYAIDRIIDVDQVESLLFIKSHPESEEEPVTEDNFYVVPIQ